jgi:hypothetical protein
MLLDTMANQASGPSMFSQFTASQVTLAGMTLTGRQGVDQVAVINYDPNNALGNFTLAVHLPGQVEPHHIIVLNQSMMQDLLDDLQEEALNPPPGLDTTLFQTFIYLLTQALNVQPSTRFNLARFGDIAEDASGTITGHLGLGIDVVGTVQDADGVITFEQHPVPLPPGPLQPLSPADAASLAAALDTYISTANPPADPLWVQVAEDLGG